MLHANDSSPTKVHKSQMMRMKREVFPRAPQVSVVTRTIYASSTVTATTPPQVESVPIPLGPIVGGIIGGMLIVLVAVGGWWWWGSRLRASKAKGAKARRAQNLTAARAKHSKTDSTETLKTNSSSKLQEPLSEKPKEKQSANAGSQESVQKPSAILAQERNKRPPFMHQTNSSASLASSKYAPARPSPLALNVVTRAPSAMSEHLPTVLVTAPSQPKSPEILSPQTAALRSLVPLPPKVNVVPPSPPPPVHRLPAPAADRNQRESVQSVQSVQSAASEYSLDSPVGIAYGGDELEREPYINPRDEWRSSQDNIKSQMRTAAQARGPFNT